VRDMLHDPDDLAILEGILGLAKAFHREAIAEGVETMAHGQLLLQLGCQVAQGYGIARPMPASQIPQWIDGWRPDPLWVKTERLKPEMLALVYASVEHRAWTHEVEAFLSGTRELPPASAAQCAFKRWLDKCLAQRDMTDATDEVNAIHLHVHQVADELMKIPARDLSDATQARLREFRALRDQLLDALQGVIARS